MRRISAFLVLGAIAVAAPAAAQQTLVGNRLIVANDSDLSGDVGHPDYVSQLTRWKITPDGAGDFRYLFTDELHAKSFIADLEQALAGGQIISKSVAVLASNYTVPAAGGAATMTVRDLPSAENMAVFESGDTIRLRTFSRASGSLTIADAYGVVTSYVDQAGGVQDWTFTRNTGADAGGMTGGTVIQADAIVLDYGVSGNGFHEVNAIDGIYGINSPYSQVITWEGASPIAANLTVRSRIGNLRGITGNANDYGIIAGTYAATGGQYFLASNLRFELHGIDLSLWEGATKTVHLNRTAPSFALGSSVPTAYGTGTGVWMGNDGGTYKFRVGDPAGARLTWDGTTLAVVGLDGNGITNINGGNIQTDTITATQIAADTITASEIAANAITASELNAGSVTATKISVSTLSAITADLGTVTAGTIDGVTIRAGSGDEVTLNSSGITIEAGTGLPNSITWNDGSNIFSSADVMHINASSSIHLGASTPVIWNGTAWYSTNSGRDLGRSGDPWDKLFISSDLFFTSPPTTTSDDDPMVYSVALEKLIRKTDGFSGTCSNPTSIEIESGIVVGCS